MGFVVPRTGDCRHPHPKFRVGTYSMPQISTDFVGANSCNAASFPDDGAGMHFSGHATRQRKPLRTLIAQVVHTITMQHLFRHRHWTAQPGR